tara:strand:- start:39 stop:515 length:477 start_codon:yes stop_codon:yes gene_type:complete
LKQINAHKIIGLVLTFLLAFNVVTNFGTYSQPDDATIIKEGVLKELENRKVDFEDDDLAISAIESYKKDIDQRLNIHSFKKLSLYRIIGCIVMLIGVVFLRMKKSIGLHLYFAGGFFTVITGFYVMGGGILGWIFNLWYIMLLLVFGVYFFIKRTELS